MSDEEIIRRRLIFDGDGTGEDRRLNVLMRMITKWVNDDDDTPAESQIMYDKILGQLSLIEHCRKRSSHVQKTTQEELANYKSMYEDYEKKIEEKREEINKQRKLLEKAKTTKQNRIQYDLLAKAISKEPARTKTNEQLATLQKELADLAQQKSQLDKVLDVRKKQFYVLSTSANALRNALDKENEPKASGSSSESTATAPEAVAEQSNGHRGPSVEPMSE